MPLLKLLIGTFLLLTIQTLSAQDLAPLDVQRVYFKILNMAPIKGSQFSVDNRYEGVQGTPYHYDDYRVADFVSRSGDTLRDLKVRLNLSENQIEIFALGTHNSVEYEVLRSIHIQQNDGTVSDFIIENRNGKEELLEVVYKNELTFYKILSKTFQKADYEHTFNAQKPYDEYVAKKAYYLVDASGNWHKVKSLSKIFPKQKKAIYAFFEKNEVEEGQDMIPLLKTLE